MPWLSYTYNLSLWKKCQFDVILQLIFIDEKTTFSISTELLLISFLIDEKDSIKIMPSITNVLNKIKLF